MSFPLEGVNLGGVHRHGPDGFVVERCSSTTSTVGLGSVGQQGLDNKHMMMDTHRKFVLFGAVVVSMAGLARLMHGSLF
jgi:hypothetical protein